MKSISIQARQFIFSYKVKTKGAIELKSMACIGITASMYRAQSSNNGVHKRQSLSSSSTTHQAIPLPLNQKPDQAEEEIKHNEHSVGKFVDERWKNGTWDLNMFVKRGKMDWDSVIVAGDEILMALSVQFFQV